MKRKTLLGLMLVTFLAFALFAPAAPAEDESFVGIDAAHFPDAALRDKISEGDWDHDGRLGEEELRWFTVIYIPGDVQSLQGLELLAHLEQLNLDNSPISSLDLSPWPKLKHLSCNGLENLDELDLNQAPGLKELECYNLPLKKLSANPALKVLRCVWCSELTEINLDGCDGLRELVLESTPAFSGISGLGNLEKLCFLNNDLKGLDVSGMPFLKELICTETMLTELDVTRNPELTVLRCEGNQLTRLNLNGNPKLKMLDCSRNQLKELDLSANPALISAAWDDNPLETEVSTENNPLLNRNIPLDGEHFPDPAFRAFLAEKDRNGDGIFSTEEIMELTVIRCREQEIASVAGIEYFAFLETFDLSGNPVARLDVGGNPELRELSCEDCNLTELDVTGNTKLVTLNCGKNQLTALDVSGNPELEELSCSKCRLEKLNLSRNRELRSLDCDLNKLTTLDLSGNPKLETLDFSNNNLEEIDLSGNPELVRLVCVSNKLKTLDLSGNPKLYILSCGWNRLTELEVQENVQLTELNAEHNPFSMTMKFETVTQDGETYAVLEEVPVQAEVTVPARTEDGIPVRVIGQHSVADNDMIEKLVIPEGVRIIDQWAIRNNPNLRALVLPSTLETIRSHAVYNCPELAEVEMNSVMAEIGREAFYGIKSGVTGEAAAIAYEGWICRDLENGTLEAADYIGEQKAELVLPAILGGKQITALGKSALTGNKETVEKLILPEGLVRIDSSACWGQSRLKEVVLPSTLETIGDNAFMQCPVLESVVIPDSVKEIGKNAFRDCTALKEVRLGANLEDLGTGAFRNIRAEAPELPENVKDRAGFWYSTGGTRTDAGGEWLYEETGGNTAAVIGWAGEGNYPKTVVFPAEVDGLQVSAVFLEYDTKTTESLKAEEKRRSAVTKLVFPEGITTIGSSAVSHMRGVTDLAIPEGVTSIPHDFANSMGNLVKVSLPSTLKVIGEYAFNSESKLKEVRFPEGLERIEKNAFSNCGLTRIELPASLLRVGDFAFDSNGGKKLPEVIVHGFSTEFGLGVFGYSVNDKGERADLFADVRLANRNGAPLKITCGRGSAADLLYCYNVQKKYTPYGTEGILTIEAGSEPAPGQIRPEDGIYEIVVSEGVESLPEDCFSGLTTLVRVSLPSTLREIGGNAFSGCVSLEEINLPEGLAEIREGTFRNCRSLKKIKLPESIVQIGDEAFRGCSALGTVNIPAGLKSIGKEAFRQETEAVQYTYLNTGGKKTFSSLKALQLPAGLEEIGEAAFAGCDALTKLIFGKGTELKEIQNNTFSLCLHLKELSLPSTVERIGTQAFSDCRGMTKLDLGASLKEVGDYAFLRCESLTRLAFPDTVETIGANLFSGMMKKTVFICAEGSSVDSYIQTNYRNLKVQRPKK